MTAPATVLFDGFCNFCDASVQFMIANDPHKRFRFAASQSEAGQAALRAAGINEPSLGSIVLIDADGVHVKSDATLRIAAGLRFPWPLVSYARAIPASIRDAAYMFVSRNRMRIFGRRMSCRLPTPDERERFL